MSSGVTEQPLAEGSCPRPAPGIVSPEMQPQRKRAGADRCQSSKLSGGDHLPGLPGRQEEPGAVARDAVCVGDRCTLGRCLGRLGADTQGDSGELPRDSENDLDAGGPAVRVSGWRRGQHQDHNAGRAPSGPRKSAQCHLQRLGTRCLWGRLGSRIVISQVRGVNSRRLPPFHYIDILGSGGPDRGPRPPVQQTDELLLLALG